MDHLMLDLETWGLRRGHAIRAIGAVPFDPATGNISDHGFYQNVGFLSQEKIGLTKLKSTVDWWEDPAQDAARTFLEPDQDSIYATLAYFGRWLRETYPELDAVKLWTRGNMDVEVLEGVFEAAEVKWPFNFRMLRDSRVILALVEYDTTFGVDMTFKGTPHYALDDARHEAYAVSEVYKHRLLNVPADHLAVMLVDDGVRVPGFTSLTDAPDLVEEAPEGTTQYHDLAMRTAADTWYQPDPGVQSDIRTAMASLINSARKINRYKSILFYGKDPGEPDIFRSGDLIALDPIQRDFETARVHAIFGIASEGGELMENLWAQIEGPPTAEIDANYIEETGDIDWYQELLAASLFYSVDNSRRDNIAKLAKRYPEKFTEEAAIARADKMDDGAEDGSCDCAASMPGNGPPHHPTCPMFTEEEG